MKVKLTVEVFNDDDTLFSRDSKEHPGLSRQQLVEFQKRILVNGVVMPMLEWGQELAGVK